MNSDLSFSAVRPYRYVRQDFFLARTFDNLAHLNAEFDAWLTMSNERCHATTRRVVARAFENKQPLLRALPPQCFPATLVEERRINRDGMVSFQGNVYSVPDGVRTRTVGVQACAFELRIVKDGSEVIARHAIPNGKGNRVLDPAHRAISREAEKTAEMVQPVSQHPLLAAHHR